MTYLKDGAYTGSTNEGNPYQGGIGIGIAYDTFEANFNVIEQNGNHPLILTPYRAEARELVKYLFAERDHKIILDLGSGTGISTLELLSQNPEVHVLGVENSESMLQIACYKFHQINGDELLKRVVDDKLLRYWQKFRAESKRYKDRGKFLLGDFQETDEIKPESIDGAIGNQFMHWTDLSKSFKQLYRFLKRDRCVVWNSASHFYDDSKFLSVEYGFRYNDFLRVVLDEVSKKVNVGDYKIFSRPKHNLGSIRSITSEQGFETEQVATQLIPYDLQVFIRNHVPVFIRQLIASKMTDDEIKNITRKAIAEAINTPKSLEDTKHKYEIVPIFKSTKI